MARKIKLDSPKWGYRIVIAASDDKICMRDEFYDVDCTRLRDMGINAVQWYGEHGEIDYIQTPGQPFRLNDQIDDLTMFEPELNEWPGAREKKLKADQEIQDQIEKNKADNEAAEKKMFEESAKMAELEARRFLPLWTNIRRDRDNRLWNSDWTQLPDADLTENEKKEFAEYRQALRDITDSFDTPEEVMWPPEPIIRRTKLRKED